MPANREPSTNAAYFAQKQSVAGDPNCGLRSFAFRETSRSTSHEQVTASATIFAAFGEFQCNASLRENSNQYKGLSQSP